MEQRITATVQDEAPLDSTPAYRPGTPASRHAPAKNKPHSRRTKRPTTGRADEANAPASWSTETVTEKTASQILLASNIQEHLLEEVYKLQAALDRVNKQAAVSQAVIDTLEEDVRNLRDLVDEREAGKRAVYGRCPVFGTDLESRLPSSPASGGVDGERSDSASDGV